MSVTELPTIEVQSIDIIKSNDIAKAIIYAITNGHIDPLEFMVKKKLVEKALEQVLSDIDVKEIIETELAKYPKGKATVLGAEITQSTRTTINYKEDKEWTVISAMLKSHEENIKAATKANCNLVDDDGEIMATPVSTTVSDYFTVKLPK